MTWYISMLRNINIGIALTLSRLVILPAGVWGVATGDRYVPAAAMLAAVLTDLADGGFARILGQWTQRNKDLDSTVDFILIHIMFVALFVAKLMEAWQFGVVYAAMLGTLALQLLVGDGGSIVRTRFGRLTGALEYFYLLLIVAGPVAPHYTHWPMVNKTVFVLLSAAAAVYVIECVILLKRRSREKHVE